MSTLVLISRVFLIAALLSSPFIARSIPFEWSWEGGLLEWTQVGVLAVGLLIFLIRFYKAHTIGDTTQARLWLLSTPLWLGFIGREISWGRALFPIKVPGNEPTFVPMADLRFGFIVHPIIITLTLLWIITAIKYGLHKKIYELIKNKHLPAVEFAITTTACAYSLYAAKNLRIQPIEEIAEVITYLGMVAMSLQSRHNLHSATAIHAVKCNKTVNT